MRTTISNLTLALGLVAAAFVSLPAAAGAQTEKVEVLVASVSTSGTQVDAALNEMARDFKRNGFAFSNFKLVTRSSLSLIPGQTGSVSLGTGEAKVTLVKREPKGSIVVRLNAPNSSSEYSIAPRGQVTVNVGNTPNGKLFVVLRR
jgi:hypothetical protein